MKIFEGLRVNTLTLFVDKYLEKKAYFELCNETMKFVFSEPGSAGLCLAYMAQHAFHRLEKHKQETLLQYTMWRFAENNDKVSIEFNFVEIFVDEESVRSLKCCIDGVTESVRLALTRKEGGRPLCTR